MNFSLNIKVNMSCLTCLFYICLWLCLYWSFSLLTLPGPDVVDDEDVDHGDGDAYDDGGI